jgi:hypothetical protein
LIRAALKKTGLDKDIAISETKVAAPGALALAGAGAESGSAGEEEKHGNSINILC